MTRAELIRELESFIHSLSEKQLKATVNAVNKKGLMNTDWDDIGCSFGAEDLADFILSRQKLLLEKIGKEIIPMLTLQHHTIEEELWRIKNVLAIIEKESEQ